MYMYPPPLSLTALIRYYADGTSDCADLGDMLYHLLGVPPR